MDGKELPWKRESPQEAADSEVKARTRQTILAHCPLSTAEPCPQEASGMLCELWQHFSSVLQKQGLGYNNWDNCTKGATLLNVSTWTSAAVSLPKPTSSLSQLRNFPLFYQSLTAPENPGHSHHPSQRPDSCSYLSPTHSASTCLTHYDVHPTSPPVSTHFSAPPSPSPTTVLKASF